jgi:glycosyltransferase involved in cell wall biosynthesis
LNKKTADNFNIEIIVVNDGSVDNTLQVLNEYVLAHRVKNISIYTTENGGVSRARNYGIKKSRHDWIGFLDADDVWISNKLEIQYKYLYKNCIEPVFIGSPATKKLFFYMVKRLLRCIKHFQIYSLKFFRKRLQHWCAKM